MLQETIFTGGSILGFFVFGTSISGQGVSVPIRVRDLEGLGVLADDMEAISVRLSLIRGRGAGGARGAEGRRFRGIFSFNISYLGRESQWRGGAGQMTVSCYFAAFFGGGAAKKAEIG